MGAANVTLYAKWTLNALDSCFSDGTTNKNLDAGTTGTYYVGDTWTVPTSPPSLTNY